MRSNDLNKVAITKFDGSLNSVKNGIERVDGLQGLKPSDHILIKPNIVWGAGGSKKIPKFGFITTSRIVEGIVAHLKEMGFNRISIGEGTIANDEVGSDTMKGFAWSGIKQATQKYGVKLVDFNKEAYEKVEMGDSKVEIAKAVLETDFLIDVPVLKTHAMTKVSLGMKNLKGCLAMKSKKKFHILDLHEMIALLNTKIEPDLTVIDGIYAMEHGPTALGRAYRTDLIITSRDVFSCDVVGAMILGVDPASVDFLLRFSEIRERTLDPASIEVLGEKLEDVKRPLQWKTDYEDVFNQAGIQGVTMQWPGDGFCTNCVVCADFLLASFCKDNAGAKIDPVEYCFGGGSKAKEDSANDETCCLGIRNGSWIGFHFISAHHHSCRRCVASRASEFGRFKAEQSLHHVFLSIAQLIFEPLVSHLLGLRPTGSRAAGATHEFPDLFYGIGIMSCQVTPSAQPDSTGSHGHFVCGCLCASVANFLSWILTFDFL